MRRAIAYLRCEFNALRADVAAVCVIGGATGLAIGALLPTSFGRHVLIGVSAGCLAASLAGFFRAMWRDVRRR
jgi:hypothetical protein